jgi:lysophospholipase L1-like esterase
MYGGSTTFGLGQRDEHTTASALAREAWRHGIALDVVNRGVVGDTHWEEAERFAWDLATLPAPDLVLFLDGINDEQAIDRLTTEDRRPMSFVKADFWKNYLEVAAGVGMDGRWAPTEAAAQGPPGASVPDATPLAIETPEDFGVEVGRRYEAGRAISRAMARQYGVRAEWFWQPSIVTRPAIDGEPEPQGREYARQQDEAARRHIGDEVHDVTDALDGHDEPLYWDQYHTNEAGATLVAKAMYRDLAGVLGRLGRG